MTEPPLDLRSFSVTLRRGRITILIAGLIGLCLAVAYGLHSRSQPRAVAVVFVPPQAATSTGTSSSDMSDQAVIAKSTDVVTPAIASLSPPVPSSEINVSATAPSNTNILRITVRAPQGSDAIRAANAIASEYITFVKKNGLVTGTPIILQRASTAVTTSTSHRLATTVPIGVVAGVLLGTVVVVARSRRDRRLRRRDDIADALGLPVLATIEGGVYKTVPEWTRFLEQYEPSPTSLWNLRRVFNHCLREPLEGEAMIRVVSYSDDQAALAAGPQLAIAAAELGAPAKIEVCVHESLAPLRAACAKLNRPSSIGHTIFPLPSAGGSLRKGVADQGAKEATWLVISILVVDRADPRWSPFGGPTILAVSPGAAMSDELARLALTASDGGGRIEGIVLVNPEPGDSGSSGLPGRKEDTRTTDIGNDRTGDSAILRAQTS